MKYILYLKKKQANKTENLSFNQLPAVISQMSAICT